jgi:hypothetical protein
MRKFHVLFCFTLLFLISSVPSFASDPTPPTDAAGRCAVIHAYEGLCGNSRPSPCLGHPGFDYFTNLEHQKIWDNYYILCVNITPNKDRYSHECLDFYGLSSTCPSTVPDLNEVTGITTISETASPYPAQSGYQAITTVQIQEYLCGLSSEQETKINAYKNACGDVAPSSCSDVSSTMTDYHAVCGEARPCDCLSNLHCGPACAALASPPVNSGDSSGGATGSGSSIVSSSGQQSPITSGGSSNATSPSASGCSLGQNSGPSQSSGYLLVWFLFFGIWAGRILRKSRLRRD